MYDQFSYNGTLTDYPNKTDWYWITHSNNDYTKFNFDYHVPQWESDCVQVFGDQHARDSHTYLVNTRHSDDSPWQFHEHTVTRTSSVPVFHATNLQPSEDQGVRMFSNFFNFIKRCCNKTDADYFWVTASVCDYSSFDFTWHPDIGEEKFVHAWTTQDNQHGYTFFVPRQEFVKQAQTLQKLEWFEYIKYHSEVPVNKLPVNTFTLNKGVADAIKNHTFTHHYEWFVEQGVDFDTDKFQPSRWDDVNLNCYGKNSSVMCVPREAKSFVIDQVYDYPYIQKHPSNVSQHDHDIVFISYDELEAEQNYNLLKSKFPRTKRLHGVKGMINALRQAASMSTSGYYYAVFAKTQVDSNFKFDYQHDRLSVPSHHIFNCYNPIIDWEYGHMGIVLYNCDIVLNCVDYALDYTTSFPVKVVNQRSCTSAYNVSPYQTWRTAFRECVKLSSNAIANSDADENQTLLNRWLTVANGNHAEWNLQGAKDAVEFVESGQDLYNIMDWQYLNSYFQTKHGPIDQ